MPRDAGKAELPNNAIGRSLQLQAYSLIDDPQVALEVRERLAQVLRGRRDIEQQPRLARICSLGEVKPERAIVQRLRGAFEKRALRGS